VSIATVGGITLGNDGNAAGTTVAASRTVTTGNLLACWVSWASAAGTSATVSDPTNGAWTGAGNAILDATAGQYLQQFYFPSTAAVAGALVVTATVNASTTKKTIAVIEVSGCKTSSPLVGHKESAGSTTPATLLVSSNYFPVQTFGMCQHSSGALTPVAPVTSVGPGDAESGVSSIATRVMTLVDILLGGGDGPVWTVAGAASWHGAAMGFKDATGGTVLTLTPVAVATSKALKNTGKKAAVSSTAAPARSNNVGHVVTAVVAATLALARSYVRLVAVAALASLVRSRALAKSVSVSCLAGLARLREIAKGVSAQVLGTSGALRGLGRSFSVSCSAGVSLLFGLARSFSVSCSAGASALRGIGKSFSTSSLASPVVQTARAAFLLIAVSVRATPSYLRGFSRRLVVGCVASLRFSLRFFPFIAGGLGRIVRALKKARAAASVPKSRNVWAAIKKRDVR
jgi:hypothetical protein